MKKKSILLAAALLAMSGNAFADEFLLEDFSIEPGETKEVSFVLNNPDQSYIAFEFFMTLPEGISIVNDEDGYLDAVLNNTRSNRHSFEVDLGTDGTYHFLCYSTKNSALKGTEGELISMRVKADETLADGVLEGMVSTIKFSDPSENKVVFDDFTFSITVGNPQPVNPQITITNAGMATYCSPYDLDFTNVEGLKAYIITGYDWINRRVYAMRVFDVPAGTGLYLVGKPGDYTIEIGSTGSYYVANMLVGTLAETTINPTDGDLTNLRLTGSSPQDASFKTFTQPRTFSANRAYLQIPTAVLNNSANAVGIVFDDEVDGIRGISQNAVEAESAWFTLDGRKLSGKPTTKGVYVVNGRKVVVR